jgi:hypothetical protein
LRDREAAEAIHLSSNAKEDGLPRYARMSLVEAGLMIEIAES